MNKIDTMSVNAIRVLSADAIQKAKSGHPGLPLGAAPMAYELWTRHMNQTATVSSYPADTVPCCYTLCFICLDTEI